MSKPQVTTAAAVTDLNRHHYQHAQEGRKHYIASDQLGDNLWNFASSTDVVDREKDRNMTQVYYLLA